MSVFILLQAVWVGHGTILRMSKTGSFQSGISKDTSRIGVTPPEGAIDMTANIAEVTIKVL